MSADQEKWQWFSGPDDEFYTNGPFASREEAVVALNCEWGFVIEATKPAVRFSAVNLVDVQYFEADGLFSDDGAEADRIGDYEEANAELQTLLDAWTEKWSHTFVTPTLFSNERNQERIEAEWEPLGEFLPDYWVEVRASPDAEMKFAAKWDRERRWTDEDGFEHSGQWVAKDDAPACWTDGLCWAVNEDGVASVQPAEWRELP